MYLQRYKLKKVPFLPWGCRSPVIITSMIDFNIRGKNSGTSISTQYFCQYQSWIDFWHRIFLFCSIAIGLALCKFLFSKQTWTLALLAMPFWYFNRWTLSSSGSVALDFISIFLMVLSLGLFDKYRRTSLLVYSFPLSIKQIAVFLAPLFLSWKYQQTRSIRKTIIAGL